MRLFVIGILYLVIVASVLFIGVAAFSLVQLWDAKLSIGTAFPDLIKIGITVIAGIGLPYCMVSYLKRL